MKNIFIFFAFCAAAFFPGCGNDIMQPSEPRDIAKERAYLVQTAKDAYVYGFPLVMMDVTKRQMTNPLPETENVPPNRLSHSRLFGDDKFKDFIRPDADMFYSFAWLDLSKEPMLFEIPDTGDRYAFFTALNAWGDVFASDGKRTAGTMALKIAFTGPGWEGELPGGFSEYRSATNLVWWIGRIQVNGKRDGETAVRKIQDEMKLYPLSAYGNKYAAPKGRVDETLPVKAPLEQVMSMSISDFFGIMNRLMVNNPPYEEDAQIMDKMLDLGVAPGMRFDASIFDFDTQEAIKEIPKWFGEYMESLRNEGMDEGWVYRYGLGNYGSDHILRAKTAYFGVGANLDADAVYMYSRADGDGETYDGGKKYILHFEKDGIPSVGAFWSVSMYNADGFFVKNPLNRFSVGSKDDIKFNKDGSLDIYIQKDNPGKDRQSNWLPSPNGEFKMVFGCYWPKETLLEGGWKVPAVKRQLK